MDKKERDLRDIPQMLAGVHGWPDGYLEEQALDFIFADLNLAGEFLSKLCKPLTHLVPEQVRAENVQPGDVILWGSDKAIVLMTSIPNDGSDSRRFLLARDGKQWVTPPMYREAWLGRYQTDGHSTQNVS